MNISLLELIKQKSQEKGRPLKIICDFDECLMPVRPASIYKITGETKPFKQYFEEFWERAQISCSSVDGNQLKGFEGMTEKEKDAIEEFKRIKKANKSRTSEIYEKNNFITTMMKDLRLLFYQ
ncbi:MAG: hypothetical protein MRECE_22c026 [Mycoplasmataceae bacterium CE_OT135]|nr:MAG: hypothetical protein MRECE_22c026 [Mycoplasmataceae bacterium CE_OT135]